MNSRTLLPGDERIPERRSTRLGLDPDADRRRPLWTMGRQEVLGTPSIGIVGTRRPSSHGLAAARQIAYQVAQAGWCVVSGLARGIDEAAHWAALEAGGVTVAVLPSPAPLGVRAGAKGLAQRIQESGLLLSDRAEHTPPAAWSFAARNHLLAALCDGLIVVEAPLGSGALMTADSATEFGLPVAFVTAPYGSETAQGGQRWVQHAWELSLRLVEVPTPTLLCSTSDLRTWLSVCASSLQGCSGGRVHHQSPWRPDEPEELEGLQGELLRRVVSVGADGVSEGDLTDLAGESPGALVAALTMLHMRGLIEQRGGRWRSIRGAVLRSRP